MKCRFCQEEITTEFIDLINSPASNSYLNNSQLNEPETFYPLKVYVCHKCFLVQVDEYKSFDSIFDNNYAYFSSYSSDWLKHAFNLCKVSIEKFSPQSNDLITEIASNDGYLLKKFKDFNYNNVLGIEPAKNIANYAINQNIKHLHRII